MVLKSEMFILKKINIPNKIENNRKSITIKI